MPTEPFLRWLARAGTREPFTLARVRSARLGAALLLLSPFACSDGSQVIHSDPPSAALPAAASDAGIVVHGADPRAQTRDAAAGDQSGLGDVTGSTLPRGDAARPDAARPEPSSGDSQDTGAPPGSSDAALPEGDDTSLDAAVSIRDAGMPGTTPGAPPTTAPAWALALLGRYAARTFTFNQDDFGTVSRAEQLTILEFVSDGDAVVLHSELCQYAIENPLSRLRLLDPTGIAVRSEQVHYAEVERSWSTEGPTFAVGYTRESPALCAGQEGKQVPKLAEQAWLTSTCTCSSVVDDLEADDCRVLDPDHDGKPGLSYVLVVRATGTTTTYYAAMTTDSHFVNGQVASDGGVPSASIKADERPYQLGCTPAGCINIASLGKACPSSFTRASFVRLAPTDTPSCAELVQRASTLFSEPAPSYPARCL